MTTYYHATPAENYFSIIADGIQPGMDGLVHMTTSPEKAVTFVRLYNRTAKIGVVAIHLEEGEAEPFWDGALSGDDHFVHDGAIAKDRLSIIPQWWVTA